jgi:L-fuculose-phosphate aldolase
VPAGQHKRLGEETAHTLGKDVAVLLANHGGVACGRNLSETLFATQIVERLAQMYLLTRAAGGAIPIPHEFVVSERERYLHKYGKAEDNVLVAG